MNHTDSWQRQYSEPGPDLKLFRARFDFMTNPRNGLTERMVVLESPHAVNVVALTPRHEILLVRQYRFGIGYETLELPGGIIDAGEDHFQGAARELREETGYTGTNWEYLGKVASNPVFQDCYIYHWLLQDAQHTHPLHLDAGEDLRMEAIPAAEVQHMLLQGAFEHPHTVSGLLRYFAQSNTFSEWKTK